MKPKAKKSPSKPKFPLLKTGMALGAVAAVGTFLLTSVTNKQQSIEVPAYHVAQVIDGDTFITTDKQYVRLASVDAPELGRCGSEEAKKALEKLIVGKPVYLKVTFRDKFQRLVSNVFTPEANVNLELLKSGVAYYGSTSPGGDVLREASDKAREQKLGVFSAKCTQTKNLARPSCTIKGNDRNGKIYYVPTCGVYNNVTVQLYLGDQWFCSESEAKKAGFRPPQQC